MAHQALHFLLASNYSFGAGAYPGNAVAAWVYSVFGSVGWDYGHSAVTTDLLSPGSARRAPKELSDVAPFGKLSQIPNTNLRVKGHKVKLFDRIFENSKPVKVDQSDQCTVVLSSSRKLFQYPDWLRKPAFLPLYIETLSAEGAVRFMGETNVKGSAETATIPIVLSYIDQSQKHLNENGTPFGGKVEKRDPRASSTTVSSLGANVKFKEIENFSSGTADCVLEVELRYSVPAFAKTHPVLTADVDGVDHAFENGKPHKMVITLSDIELALADELQGSHFTIRQRPPVNGKAGPRVSCEGFSSPPETEY